MLAELSIDTQGLTVEQKSTALAIVRMFTASEKIKISRIDNVITAGTMKVKIYAPTYVTCGFFSANGNVTTTWTLAR